MKQRLLGLVLLVLGGFISYTCVYSPLEAARRHEDKVSLSLKGAMFCPLILIVSLIYLVFGETSTQVFGTRQQPKGISYVMGVLGIGAGLLLYFWVKSQLEQAGYQFR